MPIPINDTFETRGAGYPLINAKDVAMPDGKRLNELDLSVGRDGKDGVDGKDGADGYTPVKGVDYYTEADKSEMVAAVLAALPAAEGGSF